MEVDPLSKILSKLALKFNNNMLSLTPKLSQPLKTLLPKNRQTTYGLMEWGEGG
jgi:hypothetical protein